MADVKVTALVEDTSPTFDDLLMIVNDPDGVPASRKLTIENLIKTLGWIDVRMYECVGDGVTDDAVGLQAAFNAGAGKTIFIAPGTYACSTDLDFPDTAKTYLLGAPGSILLFTGATDGLVFPDVTPQANFCKVENIELQTSNAAAGKALDMDFATNGSGYLTLINVRISVTGAGSWDYGLFGDDLMVSDFFNLNITRSCETGMRLQGICNSLRFYGLEIDSMVAGNTRGIDIAGTAGQANDQWFYGGTIQGTWSASLLRVNASSPHFFGTHFENLDGAPTDGADIAVGTANTTINTKFNGTNGGNFLFGAAGVEVTHCGISDANTVNITHGNTSHDNFVSQSRIGTYTDGGYRNRRIGCSNTSAYTLADVDFSLQFPGPSAFTSGDDTPSVALFGNIFYTSNAAPTTITMFDGGIKGQRIIVLIQDAVTTIDFTGTNLKGNAGVDWSPTTDDWLEAWFDGTDWYCAVHDCTA